MEPGRDFHEDHEPVVKIVAAFGKGSKATTAAPARGRTGFRYLGGIGLASFSRQTRNETCGQFLHH